MMNQKYRKNVKREATTIFLCSGSGGVAGLPFCDQYNATQRAEQFPNLTNPSHCLIENTIQ